MPKPSNEGVDPRAGWTHPEPPFHAGERAIQARYGLEQRLSEVGRHVMREGMPDQHREFFEELPFVVTGSVDRAMRPWASLLCGEPGFAHGTDPTTLAIRARPDAGDPLIDQLVVGAKLALLGIQFHTRRRNRANGHVASVSDAGFSLAVEQSFGNCPKYIHRRRSEFTTKQEAPAAFVHEGARLSARARELVARADTFFIASVAPPREDAPDPARGADVSHRGGAPGLVRVEDLAGSTRLTIPDYQGNYFFNTFGNLLLHPWAGLTFLDFDDGTVLQLTGTTELILEGRELSEEPGAERILRFTVNEGRLRERALPLTFRKLEG